MGFLFYPPWVIQNNSTPIHPQKNRYRRNHTSGFYELSTLRTEVIVDIVLRTSFPRVNLTHKPIH